MTNEDRDREILERQADVVRSRLGRTVEAIDQRRHHPVDLAVIARRHRRGLVIAAASAAGAVLVGGVVAALRARSRPRRLQRERVDALVRLWKHPELVNHPHGSLLGSILRKTLVATLSFAAAEVIKRGAARALTGPASP